MCCIPSPNVLFPYRLSLTEKKLILSCSHDFFVEAVLKYSIYFLLYFPVTEYIEYLYNNSIRVCLCEKYVRCKTSRLFLV